MEAHNNFKGFGEEARTNEVEKSKIIIELNQFINGISLNLNAPNFNATMGNENMSKIGEFIIQLEHFRDSLSLEQNFDKLQRMHNLITHILHTYSNLLDSIYNLRKIISQYNIDKEIGVPANRLDSSPSAINDLRALVEIEEEKLGPLTNSVNSYIREYYPN